MEIMENAYVTLVNKSTAAVKFAPYKENFNTTLNAGESIRLVATTAGQAFYYLKQAVAGVLEVTISGDATGTVTYNVCTPATIKIKNNAKVPMDFIPYRENFQFTVQPTEEYTFEATTAGQVIYYMNQDVDGALDVTVEDKKVGNK